jgi:hypothetical protein
LKRTATESKTSEFGHDDNLPQFNVTTSKEYARQDRSEEWIQPYLNSGPWANHDFSEGLKPQKRWWNGQPRLNSPDSI